MTAPEVAGWLSPLLEALDNAGIGLVVTRDGPGGLERLLDNRTVQRIMGRTPEEMRVTPPMAALAPEERVRLAAMRERVQSGEAAPALIETVVVRPDGTRVPVEIGMATHREGADTIALVFMQDLTQRRALQAKLLEADRLATVGALCAGLAHEINNPLTSVVLHLSGLRRTFDRKGPEEVSRTQVGGVLDVIMEGADRVSRAVRELMVFADPAIGRRGPVDVRAIVEGAARAARPIVGSRARLSVSIDEVPLVTGDPPRLGQAVLNLILDAALAFDNDDRDHNRVEVSVRLEEPWVVVEVADNGRTVDASACGTAFEPFFPVRGATSTGIGLAVTRTIVTTLGGTVTLVPRDGGGAVATIRLPHGEGAGSARE